MLFQRVNRTDAEKVFVIVYNASGGAFTAGQAMEYDTGTSADGIRVTTPSTAGLSAFAGLAASGIANGAYGLAQVYGYTASASVKPDVTTALVAGKILLPVNASADLSCAGSGGIAAADGKSGFIIALQTNTTMTTPVASAHKVFIRAL
jgi:hypothetical protein